jgi:hypothetical protein
MNNKTIKKENVSMNVRAQQLEPSSVIFPVVRGL